MCWPNVFKDVTLALKVEAAMSSLCQISTKRRRVTYHMRVAAGTGTTTAMRPKITYEYPFFDGRYFPCQFYFAVCLGHLNNVVTLYTIDNNIRNFVLYLIAQKCVHWVVAIHTDNFPKQHSAIGLCNRSTKRSVRGNVQTESLRVI